MKNYLRKTSTLVFLTALLAVQFLGPVKPAEAQVDYTDKVITLIVPFKNGGGTDRWARFWAPLISSELPGKPEIRIKNIVGGGSTLGANEFHKTAGDDGMILFASSASVVFPYLLSDRRVEYDFHDWFALLASPTGGVIYASPEVVDDTGLMKTLRPESQLRFLLQGPTQIGALMMLSVEMLGHDYIANFGAGGASTTFRNFREGHANLDMQTTPAYKIRVQRLVDNGSAVPLFSFGILSTTGDISRDPNFPTVPHFIEYYKEYSGQDPDDPIYDVWKQFYYAGFSVQKILFLPKNTRPEVLQVYKDAIARVLADKEELPDNMEDMLGTYDQYHGERANDIAQQLRTMTPEVVSWYRKFIKDKAGISI